MEKVIALGEKCMRKWGNTKRRWQILRNFKINPNIASALLMRAGFYDKLGKKEWAEKDRKAAALGKRMEYMCSLRRMTSF